MARPHAVEQDDGADAAAETPSADAYVPAVTAAAVSSCAYSSWAPLFSRHAHRAECVDLPQAFVDFLLEDGVHLHSTSAALPKRAAVDPMDASDSAFAADDESSDSDDAPESRFPEVHAAIEAAISRLGGAVLPKLNWSAPKDAVWVTFGGSLKCTNADEVVLLLKSSDAIAHDLQHAYAQCEDCTPQDAPRTPPQLVLKKWHGTCARICAVPFRATRFDLKPAGEFRCFVRDGRLVGVSQRHVADHFPFLHDDAPQVQHKLRAFHAEHVSHLFPQPHYTYDVYLTTTGAVRILDFNPYGGSTLPLLFTWSQLRQLSAEPEAGDDGISLPEVRVIETPQMVRPGLRTGVPFDMYDTTDGSALSELLQRCREEGAAT